MPVFNGAGEAIVKTANEVCDRGRADHERSILRRAGREALLGAGMVLDPVGTITELGKNLAKELKKD